MCAAVDGCNFKTRRRNSQDAVNDRQEGSRTYASYDHSYVNVMELSLPVQESNVDEYSAPTEYEDVDQLGSNTGDYHQLDPMTMGVPRQHVYSAINKRPNNTDIVPSADVYEEIH